MNKVIEEVDRCFTAHAAAPRRTELVEFDGYDQLDKESALSHFDGKSIQAVFECIRNGEWGWRSTHIEDWSVLEPKALRFYLAPYLKAVVLECDAPHPDVDFIANLFFHLEHVIRIRGHALFDDRQRRCLLDVAARLVEAIENDRAGRFEIGGDHCLANIQRAAAAVSN